MQKLMSGFAAAALVFALPLAANAQDAAAPGAEAQDVCTATIAPISANANATATATFESPFGHVTSIEVPEGSGLTLATEERAEMGNENAEAEAEPMAGATENVSTFTLNSENAEPGAYEITLKNESGESCAAVLTVQGADDSAADEEKAEDSSDSDW